MKFELKDKHIKGFLLLELEKAKHTAFDFDSFRKPTLLKFQVLLQVLRKIDVKDFYYIFPIQTKVNFSWSDSSLHLFLLLAKVDNIAFLI